MVRVCVRARDMRKTIRPISAEGERRHQYIHIRAARCLYSEKQKVPLDFPGVSREDLPFATLLRLVQYVPQLPGFSQTIPSLLSSPVSYETYRIAFHEKLTPR